MFFLPGARIAEVEPSDEDATEECREVQEAQSN